jgi:hypothetical protein
LESAEQRFQSEKKKIIEDYESKAKLSAGNLEKELRKEIETLRRSN